MTTIFRATSTGYRGPWSCWTPERAVAEAYTDNPGFGGAAIIEAATEIGAVLDVACREGVDFAVLAEALGYTDPAETADDWRMSGYRYPWEESSDVRSRLLSSAYSWVRYEDDYPAGAITIVSLRGA